MNINRVNGLRQSVTVWTDKLRRQRNVDNPQTKEEVLADDSKRLDKNLVECLVKKSNRILVNIRSHKFPFDLFPDAITVEEGRITIIRRSFISSSEVHSVDIKDISNIFINIAPFFAELVIVSKTFAENEIRIKNLFKKEAIFARRIIEGLRIFEHQQIETSNYKTEDLVAKLAELSTTEIVT